MLAGLVEPEIVSSQSILKAAEAVSASAAEMGSLGQVVAQTLLQSESPPSAPTAGVYYADRSVAAGNGGSDGLCLPAGGRKRVEHASEPIRPIGSATSPCRAR